MEYEKFRREALFTYSFRCKGNRGLLKGFLYSGVGEGFYTGRVTASSCVQTRLANRPDRHQVSPLTERTFSHAASSPRPFSTRLRRRTAMPGIIQGSTQCAFLKPRGSHHSVKVQKSLTSLISMAIKISFRPLSLLSLTKLRLALMRLTSQPSNTGNTYLGAC